MAGALSKRLAVVVSAVLGLLAAGCARPAPAPPPPTDSADFARTAADLEGERQRLVIGCAGNGALLGPAGDAAPERGQGRRAPSPIAFGEFWDESNRAWQLSLSFTPGPSAGDSYWQVLDIDNGRATTWWEFRDLPWRRGRRMVESVVTPEGIICWQVSSPDGPMRLSLETPLVSREAWDIGGGTAAARVPSAAGEAMVSVHVKPSPKWSFAEVGRGEDRREVLQAELGPGAFVALVQRMLPEGGGEGESARYLLPYSDFEEAARASAEAWSDFWGRSAVRVPDGEIMKWYRRSMYYLAAAAGAETPPGPMGPWPGRWGGRVFGHDTTYMHAALLTGNHPRLSGRFVEWYLDVLDSARRIARESYGLPGARYGWEQNRRGEERAPEPFRHEHHVNADIAWQAWRQAEWAGDGELAARAAPLLRDTAEFLAAHLKWDESRQAFVSPLSTDLDEYAAEVAGAIATQASAAWLAEVCGEAGLASEATERIRGRVHLPEATTLEGPVLTGHVGDSADRAMKHPSQVLPIWWLASIPPDGELARRTFESALSRVDLDRTPTFNRPWLAAAAARMHRGDRAAELLGDLLSSPGAVVDDTCFSETQGGSWAHFLTTCGAFAAAVNEMLLQCPDRVTVEVFPAVPDEWRSQGVSFERLLARRGMLVSGRLSENEVVVTLEGCPAMGDILLDLPAIGAPGGALVTEVDGVREVARIGPDERVRLSLPPSREGRRRVRVRAQGG